VGNASRSAAQTISVPSGGGAIKGLGEKFSADPYTGTGNLTLPVTLPQGRNGFQPTLDLLYSTGNGNGPFGIGWALSVPGVSRRTSKGIPLYDDTDVFLLSGAEDLVPIETGGAVTRFRPRTEGLFARIERHRDAANDHWEVASKDGLVSLYGTPAQRGTDPATLNDPAAAGKVFAWKLSETRDSYGNRIVYEYERDTGVECPRSFSQLYLRRVQYVDYLDNGQERFLVSVTFEYETSRPDAFSEYRSGFEIRTRRRCRRILIESHPNGADVPVRAYEISYRQDPLNSVSLLERVEVVGFDDAGVEVRQMPPLQFGYSSFEPAIRRFVPLDGGMPQTSLANSDLDLVDLFGTGLPDIVQINGSVRYWRNRGHGTFAPPRSMSDSPAGFSLGTAGVQLLDATGDGRADLLVSTPTLSGFFPLTFDGRWDHRGFRRSTVAPTFSFDDPEVRLVDLDGDGVTDAIRSGTRLECFFNDPEDGWQRTRFVERQALPEFPNVPFSDPRVKWADMSGDGLQDIVLVHDGVIAYWPNLGYGNWGPRVTMRRSPRYPFGYTADRVLVGDVDGDGLADVVFVEDRRVTLWMNRGGSEFSDPIEIDGTPAVSAMDAVRLTDLFGTGVAGVLWTRDAVFPSAPASFFLDFTGGKKPYLLESVDNHIGAITRIGYVSSTEEYLRDSQDWQTRWSTTLPFPVHVVSRIEIVDAISGVKHTSEYRYRHGYWDGFEREFRGFGRVEQRDSEEFNRFRIPGLHGADTPFVEVPAQYFSPPTATVTWFHQGPVAHEDGEWAELDLSHEYWSEDQSLLDRTELQAFLTGLRDRRAQRDALRTLRGSVLRTELYALDGSARENRPYTVTEAAYGVREEEPPPSDSDRLHIFFPHTIAQRTTRWERGVDPLTQIGFTSGHDAWGFSTREIAVACPRGWRRMADTPAEGYLATLVLTSRAAPANPAVHIHDRIARTTSYEIRQTAGVRVEDLKDVAESDKRLNPVSHVVSFYDGPAFQGLPSGTLGAHGGLSRVETLAITEDVLARAYPGERPVYLTQGSTAWPADYPADFQQRFPATAGYVYRDSTSGAHYLPGHYAITERRQYDTPQGTRGNGLLTTQRDALGKEMRISFDRYAMLPVSVSEVLDAAAVPPRSLTTLAEANYRTFQPALVTDVNGNRTRVEYSAYGAVAAIWLMGKASVVEGDRQQPSTRFEYVFRAFTDSSPEDRQPVFARTIKRLHHDTETDVPLPLRDTTVETREYSDGFGRLIQTRTLIESVTFEGSGGAGVLPVDQSDPATSATVTGRTNSDPAHPNVIVSGWKVYDNKGRVVEVYEPSYDRGWDFQDESSSRRGPVVKTFYDPRGRSIRVVNPDGTERRAVHGVPGTIAAPDLSDPDVFEPTPWETYIYDPSDNAGRTNALDTLEYRHHWSTPASVVIDALGRTVRAVSRDRNATPQGAAPAPIEEHEIRTSYDIKGNVLGAMDALGRQAFRHEYDLLTRLLRVESLDGGIRRKTYDAVGNIVERWDGRGARVLHSYDVLHRPTLTWARDAAGEPTTLRERFLYGDDPSRASTAAAANLLGRLVTHHDEAGREQARALDFKGNITESERTLLSDEFLVSDLEAQSGPAWTPHVPRVDWSAPPANLLETTSFVIRAAYDAIGRVKWSTFPDCANGERYRLLPRYDAAGPLAAVDIQGPLDAAGNGPQSTYIERIVHNSKGQRTLIAYGNGVMTRSAHDPLSSRLTRLRTERFTRAPGAATEYQPAGGVLQDLAYDYDTAGNLTLIADRTPGCGIQNSTLGPDALDRVFTYDALYRLIRATGRECRTAPQVRGWDDEAACDAGTWVAGSVTPFNAPRQTQPYWESYEYDPAGNMLALRHGTGIGRTQRWVRHFGFGGFTPGEWRDRIDGWRLGAAQNWGSEGNRPTHVGDDDPNAGATHQFDVNGNTVQENTERFYEWDHSDRMKAFRNQTGTSRPTAYALYLYDSTGARLKKLVWTNVGEWESTTYVTDEFERHRRVAGSSVIENNELRLMDGDNAVAMIRVGPAFPGDGASAAPVRYCLPDHRSNIAVVVGGANASSSAFISGEEYFPYGQTSLGSYARKRYRFAGREIDSESSLQYCLRRYLSTAFGHWLTPDPVAYRTALTSYSYCRNSPLTFVDPDGLQEVAPANTSHKVCQGCHGDNSPYSGAIPFRKAEPTRKELLLDAIASLQPPWKYLPFFADVPGMEELTITDLQSINALPSDQGLNAAQKNYVNGIPIPVEPELTPTEKAFSEACRGTMGVVDTWNKGLMWKDLLTAGSHVLARKLSGAASPTARIERVQLDKKGLPRQIKDLEFDSGPAYTVEEMGEAGHHLQAALVTREGQVVASWAEVSGKVGKPAGLSFPYTMYQVHTEVKALSRVKLQPGDTLLMFGERSICTRGLCNMHLRNAAFSSGADIVYHDIATGDVLTVYFGRLKQVIDLQGKAR
jgi:RHS repeat-associated protein